MKQTEKLDILLRCLYKFKYDGKYHSIQTILSEEGIEVNREEAYSLCKRLYSEGMIEMVSTKEDVSAEITSYGIEYCEGDSYTYSGSAIINNNYQITVTNSPGANIVNQSSNIKINSQINNISELIDKILQTIENDDSIDLKKKMDINECAAEVKNNLKNGQIPKFGIRNLISLIGDISSVSSLIMTLIKMG
ncbi:MAG TPA: hypothetical protein P5257_10490 [Bacteroidales bacterium]|nr:hypothetical protein [Bacteroidales bacterium]HRT90535.1 hypothetical protein [Bacteroidales bacterium]